MTLWTYRLDIKFHNDIFEWEDFGSGFRDLLLSKSFIKAIYSSIGMFYIFRAECTLTHIHEPNFYRYLLSCNNTETAGQLSSFPVDEDPSIMQSH